MREKNVSPFSVSSLHKELAVRRRNINWYIYFFEEADYIKMFSVSDCHCWIWKVQIIHPLFFAMILLTEGDFIFLIWLPILLEFTVITLAAFSNMVQQARGGTKKGLSD